MPVAIFLAALCAALAVAPDSVADWLALDRPAMLAGEWWRLWNGHLVHFSPAQALCDVAALFVVVSIAEREAGSRTTALAALLGAPLISLGLLLVDPQLTRYEGASGLALLLGTLAAVSLWRRALRLRGLLVGLGLALVAKTLCEATGGLPELSSLPAEVRVAWPAHVLGAVLGLAAGWALPRARSRTAPAPHLRPWQPMTAQRHQR